MKLNKLASAISRGKWLIEPRTAMVERQRAVKFLSGDMSGAISDMEEPKMDMPFAMTMAGGYWDADDTGADIFAAADSGSVAIIPICGTIMKYDYCGSPGTDTLSEWVKAAIDSPQIEAVVLLINSGGGSVEGTGEFADLIASLSQQKPIVALSEGMIASAAYWIGCSANELWATHKTVEIGSIGVAVTFFDDSKAMDQAGYQDIYINADTSPDKNMDYFQAIAGDFSAIRASVLNPTDDIFMSSVKERRAGRLKLTDVTIGEKVYQEPLTGKVYLAEAAIENGLIDNIGNLEAVIARAIELSENKDTNQTQNTMSNNKNAQEAAQEQPKLSKWDKLINFLSGMKAEEIAEQSAAEEVPAAAPVADDDEEMKKPQEESPEMDGGGNEDENDEIDENDPNDIDDPEKDDAKDDIEINGKSVSGSDLAAIKAEIAAMKEAHEKQLAILNAELQAKNEQIAKTAEEVKKEIKSTFVPKQSSRADRMGVQETELDKVAAKKLAPKEGSIAESVFRNSIAKAASRKK